MSKGANKGQEGMQGLSLKGPGDGGAAGQVLEPRRAGTGKNGLPCRSCSRGGPPLLRRDEAEVGR